MCVPYAIEPHKSCFCISGHSMPVAYHDDSQHLTRSDMTMPDHATHWAAYFSCLQIWHWSASPRHHPTILLCPTAMMIISTAVCLGGCDGSAAPTHGTKGDCTAVLALGSTCQPTCNSGYVVSGMTSCSAQGTLAAATCVSEREALVALYHSTNGPGWDQKWDITSADHCKWYGITCNGAGLVTEM